MAFITPSVKAATEIERPAAAAFPDATRLAALTVLEIIDIGTAAELAF
jgi:hypothetical protein